MATINRLSLNIDKTSWLFLARFHLPQRTILPFKLKISGMPVEQTAYVKYFGLTIDGHLNLKKSHVHKVSEKISSGIGILSKLRDFVTYDILTQLYYSLMYLFLAYSLVVWGNTCSTTLKPIVTLQKHALHIITFSKQYPQSSPIFAQLGLIKFMDLVTMQTAVFMFQHCHNILQKAFDNYFSFT